MSPLIVRRFIHRPHVNYAQLYYSKYIRTYRLFQLRPLSSSTFSSCPSTPHQIHLFPKPRIQHIFAQHGQSGYHIHRSLLPAAITYCPLMTVTLTSKLTLRCLLAADSCYSVQRRKRCVDYTCIILSPGHCDSPLPAMQSTVSDTCPPLAFPAAEEEPKLLGTVENKLGFAEWLKEEGHE